MSYNSEGTYTESEAKEFDTVTIDTVGWLIEQNDKKLVIAM